MSCKYNEVKLGDVCIFGDGAHTKVNRVENGIPYLTSKNIKNGYIDLQNVDYITNEDYIKLFGESQKSVRHLQEGDVLIGIIGTFGNCYLYKDNDKFGISSSIAIARPNKDLVNPKFLYYYLSSDRFKKYTDMYKGGSVQGYTNLPTLRKIPMYLPPLEKQEKIADILSSLDDKIELNNEMNKTLEEMAQSIYKRWFVDFEFPNEDGLPYKSSGGEMVESELGMIPKGWEVKTIEEISTTVSKGTTPTKKDMDSAEDENNINFIKVKDIDDYGEICLDNLEKIPESVHNGKLKRSILYEKDILFSIAGTIGRVTAIDKTLNNSNMNQAIAFIRLKDCRNMFNFIFYLLKSEKTQNDIKSNIVQAVQANVSLGVLKAIKFVQPSKEILDKYNNIAMNIYDKQQNIRYENNDLKIIRDNLLPKLMSGEIILDKKIIIY